MFLGRRLPRRPFVLGFLNCSIIFSNNVVVKHLKSYTFLQLNYITRSVGMDTETPHRPITGRPSSYLIIFQYLPKVGIFWFTPYRVATTDIKRDGWIFRCRIAQRKQGQYDSVARSAKHRYPF